MMSGTSATEIKSPDSGATMLRAMVGIGVLCALMIVLTFEGTLPRIERNKAVALEKAVFQVLPGAMNKETFQLDQGKISVLSGEAAKDVQLIYVGYDESGELAGIAVEASGLGFADVIRILYGYDPANQKIIGFHVLESKETPGLGDKIEKDPIFLENFKALDVSLTENKSGLENAVVPVKKGSKKNPWEVDGITGATISSRAIGNIIGSSTEKWIPLIYKSWKNSELIKQEKDKMKNG